MTFILSRPLNEVSPKSTLAWELKYLNLSEDYIQLSPTHFIKK